jgi:hypothetical protein
MKGGALGAVVFGLMALVILAGWLVGGLQAAQGTPTPWAQPTLAAATATATAEPGWWATLPTPPVLPTLTPTSTPAMTPTPTDGGRK